MTNDIGIIQSHTCRVAVLAGQPSFSASIVTGGLGSFTIHLSLSSANQLYVL
jgi:hypothetical protein